MNCTVLDRPLESFISSCCFNIFERSQENLGMLCKALQGFLSEVCLRCFLLQLLFVARAHVSIVATLATHPSLWLGSHIIPCGKSAIHRSLVIISLTTTTIATTVPRSPKRTLLKGPSKKHNTSLLQYRTLL